MINGKREKSRSRRNRIARTCLLTRARDEKVVEIEERDEEKKRMRARGETLSPSRFSSLHRTREEMARERRSSRERHAGEVKSLLRWKTDARENPQERAGKEEGEREREKKYREI